MTWQQVLQQAVIALVGGLIALLPYILQTRRQDVERRREIRVAWHRQRIDNLWAISESLSEAEELDMQAASLVEPIAQAEARISELNQNKDDIVPKTRQADAGSFERDTYSRIYGALLETVRQRDALRDRQADVSHKRRSALLRARAAAVRYGRIPPEFVGKLPSEMLATYTDILIGGLMVANRLKDDTAWTAALEFQEQIANVVHCESRLIDNVMGIKGEPGQSAITLKGLAAVIPKAGARTDGTHSS